MLAHRQLEVVAAVRREKVRCIDARLLAHLTQGTVALGLVLVDLALGERPRSALGPSLDENTLRQNTQRTLFQSLLSRIAPHTGTRVLYCIN